MASVASHNPMPQSHKGTTQIWVEDRFLKHLLALRKALLQEEKVNELASKQKD